MLTVILQLVCTRAQPLVRLQFIYSCSMNSSKRAHHLPAQRSERFSSEH